MRGLNRVIISGNVGHAITYQNTPNGAPACSFQIASDRQTSNGPITAWVKINAYGDKLVPLCESRLEKGLYVIVEGELMNRTGKYGELTEVRAREIIFTDVRE